MQFNAFLLTSVETLHQMHCPHWPIVCSFIEDHYSLILPFTRASATSERDVVCREVEQLLSRERNALTMDPASALTAFYGVHVACWITDNARKTDAKLTLGDHRFDFGYSISRHHNTAPLYLLSASVSSDFMALYKCCYYYYYY